MTRRTILLPLARLEGVHLARLADEFAELLSRSRGAGDPALRRLTPDAYPDDVEATAEFARATRDDLLDHRLADVLVVRRGLVPFLDDDTDEDDTLLPRDLVIAEEDLDPWLRTLTALRLVIASRLGIDSADEHDPEDPRFGVYDWLGYRLDGLIGVADSLD